MTKTSVITCPECGHQTIEQMPTDACQHFYVCKGCGEKLKPKPGDCCVFCSYGSVRCPLVQAQPEVQVRETKDDSGFRFGRLVASGHSKSK